MTKPPETPRFLFERHPEIEVSHGWALAGVLTIDVPKVGTACEAIPASN